LKEVTDYYADIKMRGNIDFIAKKFIVFFSQNQ